MYIGVYRYSKLHQRVSTSAKSLKTKTLNNILTKGEIQMPRKFAFPGFRIDEGVTFKFLKNLSSSFFECLLDTVNM